MEKNGLREELESKLTDLETTMTGLGVTTENLNSMSVAEPAVTQAMWKHLFAINQRTDMLLAYCKGLTAFRRPVPFVGNIFWKLSIRPKILKRGEEILYDMILIRREGGYRRLDPAELVWCVLRYQNEGALRLLQKGEWDPMNLTEKAKVRLVALLEAQADAVLSYNLVAAGSATAAYLALIT